MHADPSVAEGSLTTMLLLVLHMQNVHSPLWMEKTMTREVLERLIWMMGLTICENLSCDLLGAILRSPWACQAPILAVHTCVGNTYCSA